VGGGWGFLGGDVFLWASVMIFVRLMLFGWA
jgi:hypothetical protein